LLKNPRTEKSIDRFIQRLCTTFVLFCHTRHALPPPTHQKRTHIKTILQEPQLPRPVRVHPRRRASPLAIGLRCVGRVRRHKTRRRLAAGTFWRTPPDTDTGPCIVSPDRRVNGRAFGAYRTCAAVRPYEAAAGLLESRRRSRRADRGRADSPSEEASTSWEAAVPRRREVAVHHRSPAALSRGFPPSAVSSDSFPWRGQRRPKRGSPDFATHSWDSIPAGEDGAEEVHRPIRTFV
jgi:hypothetical protein